MMNSASASIRSTGAGHMGVEGSLIQNVYPIGKGPRPVRLQFGAFEFDAGLLANFVIEMAAACGE